MANSCMAITSGGILIYIGKTIVYEIVGGKNGQLNLRALQ